MFVTAKKKMHDQILLALLKKKRRYYLLFLIIVFSVRLTNNFTQSTFNVKVSQKQFELYKVISINKLLFWLP